MKAYAIVLRDNEISETGFKNLVESSKKVNNSFEICRFEAITPGEVNRALNYMNIQWKWPTEKPEIDSKSGLIKSPYATKHKDKRIACALSHYTLWNIIKTDKQAAVILEHDAIFTERLTEPNTSFQIVGLNDPRGATRKAQLFHQKIQENIADFQEVPRIDAELIPQGIAGNSAYYMKPDGADAMIKLVLKYGLWPNDAIMCYQLYDLIGVSRKYYTKVQGLPSTTSI